MPKARAFLYLLILLSLALFWRATVGEPPPLAWTIALLVLLLGWIFLGALVPGLQMYGDVLCSVPEAKGKVALTFDDGPDPRFTPEVLDLLARRGARATFFVLGRRAEQEPHLIRRMVEEGHTVGMHSLDHFRGFAFLTPRAVAADVEACRARLRQALGGEAAELFWFRPPVGQSSPRTFAGLRRASAEMVAWSVRGRDGLRHTTVGELLVRLRRGLSSGAIVLLHDAWERPRRDESQPPAGVRGLEEILDLCAELGLQAVSLDELVRSGARNADDSGPA